MFVLANPCQLCLLASLALSGCLFTLTLAGALIHLRAVLDRPNPPISDTCLPLESEYADDVDFLDEDLEALKQILPTATSVLKDWSLNVNEQKTEFVRVYLAGKNETDSFGAKIAGYDKRTMEEHQATWIAFVQHKRYFTSNTAG